MNEDIKVEDILFIDIETIPQFASYSLLPEEFQKLWDKKANSLIKEDQTPETIYERAGIYAEFGKIICISAGIVTNREGKYGFRVKSFFGHNESEVLNGFAKMLTRFSAKRQAFLCAHNGKEFDFPYISRRMLVNGIDIPKILQVSGKKPWEVPFLDTMEMWKFGDYKHYTSLNLLAYIFNIPTPKDDIDGSQVAHVYYNEQNLERIMVYCEKDVLTVAQLLLKYRNETLIDTSFIERVLE
jgi:3'-5' exonuclease